MSTSQITSCNSLNQPLSGSPTASKDSSTRQIQHTLRAGVLDALGVKGAGHGVRGIAAALRDVLANADPNAPDPVPALLQTINTALDTAAKTLADQGVDQPTIDAAIKRFRSDLAGALDSLAPASSADPSTSAPATSTTNAAAVHAVTNEKFSLNILTAEGDKVSIRFRTNNVTDVAATQTTGDSGTTTATDAHVISRGGLKIEVNGNLNDNELKAIGDLLEKVDGIAKDFFGGDVQAAFGAAARVSYDSNELSGFNLKLSYSQRIGFATSYAPANPPASAPSTPNAAPATPAIPSAAVPAELDPISLQPANSSDQAVTTAPITSTDTPVSTPASSDAAPSSAQQTIGSFAKAVLAKLAAVSDGGQSQFSLRWKVDFLLTALSATAPAKDPASADATKALGDTLINGVAAAS